MTDNSQTTNDGIKPLPEQTITDRQHLIDTAVRFLQNPKVIPTSTDNKKLFLAKKGMTSTEIEIALKRANCSNEPTSNSTISNQNIVSTKTLEESNSTVKPSFFSILIKWIKNFLLAGCFAFTAYKLLIKKYIMKKKKNLKKIELTEKLQESIKEMRDSLNALKESVETINDSIKQIKNTPMSTLDEPNLKGELQSIKNLLLNRNQFPSLPTVTPVIPSWQLESKNKEKLSDENTKRDDSTNATIEAKSTLNGSLDS